MTDHAHLRIPGRKPCHHRRDFWSVAWIAAVVAAAPGMAQGPLTPVGIGHMFLHPIFAFEQGEVAHVVYGDQLTPSGTFPNGLLYSRSVDRGRTWTSGQLTPGGAATFAADGSAFTAYYNVQGTTFVMRSVDAGLTWTPGVACGTTAEPRSALLAGPTCHLLAVQRNSLAVQYLRSPDGGATWPGPPLPLGTGGGRSVIRSAGMATHLLWLDLAGVMYRRSADLGVTWSPPVNFGSNAPTRWSLEAVGNVVHLAMGGPGGFTYRRSADAGVTWSAPLVSGSSTRFALAVDGSRLWLAHANTTNSQLVVARSVDDGATWSTTLLGNHGVDSVAIAADGAVAGVVYQFGIGGSCSIATTADAGNSWSLRTDSVRGFTGPVFVRGTTIAVSEYAAGQIVQCVSRDAGVRWDADRPVATPTSISVEVAGYLALPGSLGTLLLSGQYQGSARLDTRLLFGHQPYGVATRGSAGISPSLHADGEALLGRPVSFSLRSSVGGAPGLICMSASGRANIPFGIGTLLLNAPLPLQWGLASGTPGVPGVGAMTFSFTVPIAPVLRGIAVAWQGFVWDSGVASSFTSTQGIESWLL